MQKTNKKQWRSPSIISTLSIKNTLGGKIKNSTDATGRNNTGS